MTTCAFAIAIQGAHYNEDTAQEQKRQSEGVTLEPVPAVLEVVPGGSAPPSPSHGYPTQAYPMQAYPVPTAPASDLSYHTMRHTNTYSPSAIDRQPYGIEMQPVVEREL